MQEDHWRCPNSTTNRATADVGSAGVPHIAANSVPNNDVPTDSVRTVKAAATDPHSAFSKGLPSQPHADAPLRKHSHMYLQHPHGAASAYATTWDTKRWTAPQGSCAKPADVTAIFTF